MELLIKDFAKIHEAQIGFDGLTVIAGNNNTGKSTVGKILFALFDSLHHIDTRINKEKEHLLKQIVEEETWELLSGKDTGKKAFLIVTALKYFAEYIKQGGDPLSWKAKEVFSLFYDWAIPLAVEEEQAFLGNVHRRMKEARQVNRASYKKQVLKQSFGDIFHGQMNSLLYPDREAEVDLRLKQKSISLCFLQNDCTKAELGIDITSNIMYIDNPFVVDHIAFGLSAGIIRRYELSRETPMEKKLLRGLERQSPELLQTVIAQKRLEKVLARMHDVIAGETTRQGDKLSLKNITYTKPIKLENLSTGLKAFMILKLLIENQALKEKDLLVLDEPEVHLHPEWQILYAEIVVLLQQAFHLTVLLTTHSPYFLHALEVYSAKYGMEEQCRYYLAENKNNEVSFCNVTGDTEKIYQMMLKPFEDLQRMLYGD